MPLNDAHFGRFCKPAHLPCLSVKEANFGGSYLREVRRHFSQFMRHTKDRLPSHEDWDRQAGKFLLLAVGFFILAALFLSLLFFVPGCARLSVKVEREGQATKYIEYKSNLLTGKSVISVTEEPPQ